MATTLGVYTHASASAQRDAVNLLEDQLFPNVPKLASRGNTAEEKPQVLQLVVGAPGFEPGAWRAVTRGTGSSTSLYRLPR